MRLVPVGLAAGALAFLAGACSLVASLGNDYMSEDGGESPDGSMTTGHEGGTAGDATDARDGQGGGGEGGGSLDGGSDGDAQGSLCISGGIDPTFENGLLPSLALVDASTDFTLLAQLSDHELVAALRQTVKTGAFLASLSADGSSPMVNSSGYDFVVGLVPQGTTAAALLTASGQADTLLRVEPRGGATGMLASVPPNLDGTSLALAANAYIVGIQQGASFGVASYLFDGDADLGFGQTGAALATCGSVPNRITQVVAIDGGRLAATTCVESAANALELVAFGDTEPQGDAGPAVVLDSIYAQVELFAGRPGGSVAYLVSSDGVGKSAVTVLNAQGSSVLDGGTLPIATFAVPTAATVDSQDRLLLAARASPADGGAFQMMRMSPDGTIDPNWHPSYGVAGSMNVTPATVVITSENRVVVGFSVAYEGGGHGGMNDQPGIVAFCP